MPLEGDLIGKAAVAITADHKQYETDLDKAHRSLLKWDQKQQKIVRDASRGFAVVGTAVAAVGVAATASFLQASVANEKMMKGLEAVAGSAEGATKQLEELRIVAKSPGLGLPEAVLASTRLQHVRFEAEKANFYLRETGNALALVGSGRGELAGVVRGITQMQARGKVLAEEINQIAERMPQFRQAMIDAFGVGTSEEIQNLNLTVEEFLDGVFAQLGKLPRVANTASNSMENLTDSWYQFRVEMGDYFLPTFTRMLDKLADGTKRLNEMSDAQKKVIAWGTVGAAGAGTLVAALGAIGLAAPGIITTAKAMAKLVTPVTALAALDAILITWATKRIWSAATADFDEAAHHIELLTEKQIDLNNAIYDIKDTLWFYAQTGDRAAASLGDLGINVDKLNKVFGQNYTEASNAAMVLAGLEKNAGRVNKEVHKLTAPTLEEFGEGLKELFSPLSGVIERMQALATAAQQIKMPDLPDPFDMLFLDPEKSKNRMEATDRIFGELKTNFVDYQKDQLDLFKKDRELGKRLKENRKNIWPQGEDTYYKQLAGVEHEKAADEIAQTESDLYALMQQLRYEDLQDADRWSARRADLEIKDIEKTEEAYLKKADIEQETIKENKRGMKALGNAIETTAKKNVNNARKYARTWQNAWEDATFDIKMATTDLFQSMIDPRFKPQWGQFFEDLADIANRKLAEITVDKIFGQVGSVFFPNLPTGGTGMGEGGYGIPIKPDSQQAATTIGLANLGAAGVGGALIYGGYQYTQYRGRQRNERLMGKYGDFYNFARENQIPIAMLEQLENNKAGAAALDYYKQVYKQQLVSASQAEKKDYYIDEEGDRIRLAPGKPATIGKVADKIEIHIHDSTKMTQRQIEDEVDKRIIPAVRSGVRRGIFNRDMLS